MSKKRSSSRLPKKKAFDGFQLSKPSSRKKQTEVISTQPECDDGVEQNPQPCSYIEKNSESSTVYSTPVSSINDPSTANINENDIRNGMHGDGQLVMLPTLQINHITDRGGDELTFLSDEVFNTESTSCETLDNDQKHTF